MASHLDCRAATKIFRLAQDLPIVVEIIDAQEKIDAFLPVLDHMMTSGRPRSSRFENRH